MRSRLRDADAVDDVMQEIAIACLKGKEQLSDPAKLAPWLYRVAVRQVLMYRRVAGRRRAFCERFGNDPLTDPTESRDALNYLLDDERRRLVAESINSLPELDSQLLLLKYVHGFTYLEIADCLGITRNAVESRLHRARKALRHQLTGGGVVTQQG